VELIFGNEINDAFKLIANIKLHPVLPLIQEEGTKIPVLFSKLSFFLVWLVTYKMSKQRKFYLIPIYAIIPSTLLGLSLRYEKYLSSSQ